MAAVFVVGSYSAAARRFAPRYWLSGVDFDWGPAFARIARSVLTGTWRATDWATPAGMHIAKLAPFGPRVPKATRLAGKRAVALVESGRQVTSPAERRGGDRQQPGSRVAQVSCPDATGRVPRVPCLAALGSVAYARQALSVAREQQAQEGERELDDQRF